MRLREREQREAYLVRRMEKTGSLGSRPEAFSQEKFPFRAGVQPLGGDMKLGPSGLRSGEKLRLIAAEDLGAKVGDGVWLGDDFYVILGLRRWTAHIELECGAKA